ncbi:MAG: hypothetical protein EBW24_00430 [Actinobacteria bacterium]|nr:hypothetical protein [Actinomycetota bacterium]
MIDRPGADTIQDDQIGIDTIQTVTFNFLRPQLEELGLVPQVGDIIETFDFFYEVDNTQEAQFFFGKDRDHPKSVGSEFGVNLSILCTSHLTRITRLQIIDNRV